MKGKYKIKTGGKTIERQFSYIPVRYILAVLITLFEVLAIIGIVVALCYFVPYFYLLAFATEIGCVIAIIASNDNPEYKIPWLLVVLVLPIVGFMLYFLFYSRKLKGKFIRRLENLYSAKYPQKTEGNFALLAQDNATAFNQAKLLCSLSYSNLFKNTKQEYFSLGEDMWQSMLIDLQSAEKFIYLEFIQKIYSLHCKNFCTVIIKLASNRHF